MLISTKKENDAERGWGLEGGVLGRAAREGAAQTPGLESIGKGGVGSLARGIFFFFLVVMSLSDWEVVLYLGAQRKTLISNNDFDPKFNFCHF